MQIKTSCKKFASYIISEVTSTDFELIYNYAEAP